MQTTAQTLKVTSSAFEHMDFIPVQYTCDDEDVNPPLQIADIPPDTKSLALIVDDPDAPRKGGWVHWVVWNIPPRADIAEDVVPGMEGLNDFGKHAWGGPCPPSGTHRYFFKVYALDKELLLPPNTRREDLERAMEGRILARGELIGRYHRKN